MNFFTRQTLTFFLASILILLVGCRNKITERRPLPELVHAESVMFNHPDSALHILENMPMPSARWDKENHALWCLLLTQAQYKQMMKIPSDSLVRIAYDYYKPTNNARRKAMSALYMGCVNYDLENIEEAIQFYLDAKAEMEKTMDYKLGYLIMSGLGNIYLYRNLVDYALEACNQAYDYAVKDSNKRYQTTSLRYLARCYYLRGDLEKCIHIYQFASRQALELNKNDFYNALQLGLAMVYANSQRFSQALMIAKELPFSAQKLLLIGQTYLSLNKVDSAYIYLNRALCTDNIYTKRSVYEVLYKLCEDSNYNQYMKKCCDSLLLYKDSIIALDKGKEIIAYKEKYDHQKLITEQQRLKLEKADAQRLLFIITICLIVVIAVVAYLYQKRLVRKETTIRKQSEQLQDYMLQLHDNESRLMQNRQYMEELKTQLAAHDDDADEHREEQEQMERLEAENSRLQTTIQSLQQRMGEYSSRLSNARKDMEQLRNLSEEALKLKEREHRLTDRLVDSHPLMAELQKKCRTLSEAEWQELVQLCNDTWDGFTTRLQARYPQLTEQELRLCLLIRLRFSNVQLAAIFAVSPASISQKKFRLKKHLSEWGESNFPEEMTLDRWLTEF